MSVSEPTVTVDGERPSGPSAAAGTAAVAAQRPDGRRHERGRKVPWRTALRRDWQLYSLALLPLLFFLIFRYLPMLGNVIAFRRFQPGGSIFGEQLGRPALRADVPERPHVLAGLHQHAGHRAR